MSDRERSDHDLYAEWDAAYVLGALTPAERRQFEEHLATCPTCRTVIAESAVLPGLLGALPAADATALLAETPGSALPEPGHPPADLLPRLLARVQRRQRVRRWALVGVPGGVVGLAAAATVVGLVLPATLNQAPEPTVTTALQQTQPGPITASVELTSMDWGTKISMDCTYRAGVAGSYAGHYALYVVDRSGAATEVSSWAASPGDTGHTSGSTATQVSQMARIELRDLATGDTLLAHTFR